MLHTWKPQLKRCYSLIEPSATSTSTRLFNWIFLSCQRDRHPFYACCVWLLVFCTFARFHGICFGNKVARARIKVMNGFPRGPTTTSILVTSSSIQKWIWPGLYGCMAYIVLDLSGRYSWIIFANSPVFPITKKGKTAKVFCRRVPRNSTAIGSNSLMTPLNFMLFVPRWLQASRVCRLIGWFKRKMLS